MSHRTRAWSVRLLLMLVVGVAFVVGTSGEARGVSRDRDFSFGSFCVGERSSTYQSSSNALWGESMTWSLGDYYGSCSAAITKPPGYIAGRVIVYKWDDRFEDWYVCRRSGWFYNSNSTYVFGVYAPLGYPGNRWCGRGWYGTYAQGSVWHNGGWRTTKRVWSGSDYYY